MQVSSSFALLSLILALPICLYIFYADMKFKRISNKAVWALFAVFVVAGLCTLPLMEMAWRFANYAVVFAILFLMWMLRQMGAGDVKMAAVAALFVDRADAADALWLAFACLIAATFATLIVRFSPLRNLAPDWAAWRLKPSTDGVSVGKGNQMTLPMGTGIGLMLCTYLLLGAL
ncbi:MULTISPECIES: prepilin peptidase [unclassified Shimia]|uniref:prepilin peptidase n=1 Tax=unclassified Shimia TaxID=2630038 RepID=UPI001ADA5EC0|nr:MULTISPECIES: prepilin peptidase [unclassified Shimia]MBO9474399.1 prepilin peptidase [Shimia sp. R10_1]MDA5557100.1 prepilin peptidase [Shimia sp. MMG029]